MNTYNRYRLMVVALLMATATVNVYSQADTIPAVNLELDIVPARSPAFSLVDVESESVHRPSSYSELVASFSEFSDSSGGFVIPRAFGVEFSPLLIGAGPRVTLKDYKSKVMALLYRMQFSVSAGRSVGDTSGSDIAIGIRIPAFDLGDPRSNDTLISEVTKWTDSLNPVNSEVVSGVPPLDRTDAGGAVVLDLARQQRVDRFKAKLKELRDRRAETSWNEQKLEFAGAMKWHALDDKGHDPRLSEWVVWGVYSFGLGTNVRFLLSADGGSRWNNDSGKFIARATFGARGEFGSNWITMYVEGGASNLDFNEGIVQGKVNLGLDVHLGIEGLWMNTSAGVLWGKGMEKPSLQANADLKYNAISLWRGVFGK